MNGHNGRRWGSEDDDVSFSIRMYMYSNNICI